MSVVETIQTHDAIGAEPCVLPATRVIRRVAHLAQPIDALRLTRQQAVIIV